MNKRRHVLTEALLEVGQQITHAIYNDQYGYVDINLFNKAYDKAQRHMAYKNKQRGVA